MKMDSTESRWHDLIAASLMGDKPAYRQLLCELAPYLRRYFSRRLGSAFIHHAEDLVQDTLLAVHDKRHTYDPSRPFTAWLHAVAHHKFIDHTRRHAIRITVELDENLPASQTTEADIARHDLEKVLANLPQRTSGLIRSVKIEGASVAEAASRHGVSETAAKVAIHRGLKTLMARFAGGPK